MKLAVGGGAFGMVAAHTTLKPGEKENAETMSRATTRANTHDLPSANCQDSVEGADLADALEIPKTMTHFADTSSVRALRHISAEGANIAEGSRGRIEGDCICWDTGYGNSVPSLVAGEDFEFEAKLKAKAEEDQRIAAEAQAQAELLARIEAEAKAQKERQELEEAELLAKSEAEAKAQKEREELEEAQRVAKAEEEQRLAAEARARAEQLAKNEAEAKAQKDRQELEEARRVAKAEEEQRLAAEARARAEQLAKIEAETKAEKERQERVEAQRVVKAEEERRIAAEERVAKLEAELQTYENGSFLARCCRCVCNGHRRVSPTDRSNATSAASKKPFSTVVPPA